MEGLLFGWLNSLVPRAWRLKESQAPLVGSGGYRFKPGWSPNESFIVGRPLPRSVLVGANLAPIRFMAPRIGSRSPFASCAGGGPGSGVGGNESPPLVEAVMKAPPLHHRADLLQPETPARELQADAVLLARPLDKLTHGFFCRASPARDVHAVRPVVHSPPVPVSHFRHCDSRSLRLRSQAPPGTSEGRAQRPAGQPFRP